MLESASSGDDGPMAETGALDAGEHPGHAVVGTAGRDPESIEAGQRLAGAGIGQRRRRNPFGVNFAAERARGVLERLIRRKMRVIVRVKISQYPNADRFGGHVYSYHGMQILPRI